MLEKFLNKKVLIFLANYATTPGALASMKIKMSLGLDCVRKGVITNIDDKFVELDNDEIIAIQYICTIKEA